VEELSATLQRTGMPAERLVLDVTEGVLIEYPERARLILGDLRSHGVRIALDNFGTGHSSFGYLNQLPLDIVKIDRESVASSRSAETSGAIIAAMTRLAHALGLTVVIEGVETGSQRTAAEEVGADLAQGYYYGPPMAARDIDEMLRTASASTRLLKLPLQRASDDHSRVSR
jgi:EAL domain-containing protein (putative c-di-GMP-specific phosphodiesterase class I)